MNKILMTLLIGVGFMVSATSFAYPESFRHGHFMTVQTFQQHVQQANVK